MKLRIKGNNLRLRLSKSEVKTFDVTGIISDQIKFPSDAYLQYTLIHGKGNTIEASTREGMIQVKIPTAQAKKWCSKQEEVGLYGELPLSNKEHLSIAIEKDFQCLTIRPGEDESDLYSNPSNSHDEAKR